MTELTVHVDLPSPAKGLIEQTFSLLSNHFEVTIRFGSEAAHLTIGTAQKADIQISEPLLQAIGDQELRHESLMVEEPLIRTRQGDPDYLGTCAYMAHYLQEQVQDPSCFDALERFRYDRSYQHKFTCVERNLVLEYLIKLQQAIPQLQHLKRQSRPTQILHSHDIDTLVHSIWPDLKTAIRRLRLGTILRLLLREIWRDQDRQLFEKILRLHAEQDRTAIFFWMVNQALYHVSDGSSIENANYDISSPKVRAYLQLLEHAGHVIQLHQSLGSPGLAQERDQLGTHVTANRNHYLHGKLPDIWAACDRAGIQEDHTAGFSEVIGFRNSYGLPLQPYDLQRDRPFAVIEVPLHVMDVTLMKSGLSPSEAQGKLASFLDRHGTDCLLSMLWHNNYLSEVKYGDWLEVWMRGLRCEV